MAKQQNQKLKKALICKRIKQQQDRRNG